MKTRYKIGKFNSPVVVYPGDQLNVTITDCDNSGNKHREKVSEEITISMEVTHWAMFYVAGIGFGGMFGGPDLSERINEIFVDPERIDESKSLIV